MYRDPSTVLSPKNKVKSIEVLYDSGPIEGSWSVAQITWGDKPAVGIRWNGDSNSQLGLPQSRGNPAWFVVPDELQEAVLKAAREASQSKHASIEEGYRMMAADREREAEAEEWTEGLIGDAY
ncbi:MAG: hypothetical protein WCF17_08360 [Terracidiphilus sp.]